MEQGRDTHGTTYSFCVKYLEAQLRGCCDVKSSSGQLKKEKLWGLYHQKRTSKDFNNCWHQFLESLIKVGKAHPAFYQYITQELFTKIIEEAFPVTPSTSACTASVRSKRYDGRSLNYVEQNAVRYVAGYTCRKLHDTIQSSTNPNKNAMILCLSEMTGDDSDVNLGSEDWTNTLDRGGLWLVNDQTFTFFAIMEELIQSKWTKANVEEQGEGAKQSLINTILQNEDILFQWSFCSSGLDDEKSLLAKIVELFVTVRGFARASCLELLQQAHQKTLQKKKHLEKLYRKYIHS